MITSEQFLRRSLLVPIILPLIVCGHVWMQSMEDNVPYATNFWFAVEQNVAYVSGVALLFGFIPYVWMLFVKREELHEQTGAVLEDTIKTLPLTMIPYFLKIMIIPGVICLFIPYCFWVGPTLTLIGILATFVVGYIYVGITFGFLRLFQRLRIVE